MARFFAFMFCLLSGPVFANSCQPPRDKAFSCSSREFEACEIQVGDTTRHYCQHVPAQGGDLPAVFAFHGAGGKSKALVNLWRSYTEQSMIVIVPEAQLTRESGDCSVRWRQLGTPVQDWSDFSLLDACNGQELSSDLKFTSTLMDLVSDAYGVSDFYAMGFSNGAGFTYQLYMTQSFAERFSGFGAAGAGMDRVKLDAMLEEDSNLEFAPNKDTKRPFLFQIGTQDKKNIAFEEIIAAVDGNPDCMPVNSAKAVMDCFAFTHLSKSVGVYDMPTRRSITRDWLLEFNNAESHRHESLYPNLGMGAEPADKTMTVREDYLAKQNEDSAAVSVLTTIDGGHDWPGWGGNRAPCPSRNCDVDLLHEILQFWRANAGMKLPLP